MLKKLVKNEWWTDTTEKTDENGRIDFSGFKGEYKLTAGDICADATLTDDQEEHIASWNYKYQQKCYTLL